jgi:hypothetical protein
MNIRRWLSTFFVICISTVSAEALDANDVTRMNNLVRKYDQLLSDLSNVQKASPSQECLNELYHNLELTEVASLVDEGIEQQIFAQLAHDGIGYPRPAGPRGQLGIKPLSLSPLAYKPVAAIVRGR